jgi:sulfite reductase alpha subunit-like flavoprotein
MKKGEAGLNSCLAHVSFTLLGLGSSDYSSFMKAPIDLRDRLLALGATFFYEFGKADEATSLELVVEPWSHNLWPSLSAQMAAPVKAPEAGPAEEEKVGEDSEIKEGQVAIRKLLTGKY